MENLEKILEKLSALEDLVLGLQHKTEKGLWDIQDVADYCGFSYRHVYGWIITDPRFPAEVDLQSRTGGKAKRVFVAQEVKDFFARYKKKKVCL